MFKLWHKKVKCWIGCNPCIFQNGQLGRWSSNVPFIFLKAENIEIVRNSGIKDIKEKGIYEGDILKRTNSRGNPSLEMSYGIIKKETETNNLIFEWYWFNEYRSVFRDPEVLPLKSAKHYMVIGNKYDNPELLSEVEQ